MYLKADASFVAQFESQLLGCYSSGCYLLDSEPLCACLSFVRENINSISRDYVMQNVLDKVPICIFCQNSCTMLSIYECAHTKIWCKSHTAKLWHGACQDLPKVNLKKIRNHHDNHTNHWLALLSASWLASFLPHTHCQIKNVSSLVVGCCSVYWSPTSSWLTLLLFLPLQI
jgi:hypothetical protein